MNKFIYNDIITLLDSNLTYNLAESTSQDLKLQDVLSDSFFSELAKISLGYSTSKGNSILRDLIGSKLDVHPDNVLITNGASGAIFLTIMSLCSIGDEVITTEPNFPCTLDIIPALGAVRKTVKVRFEDNFKLNIKELEELLNLKTKLLILVSPNNPTGTSQDLQTIMEIEKLVARKSPDAFILLDETYREATYGIAPARSVAGISERILSTSSLSKAHGSPGIRVGWLSCSHKVLMQQLTLAKMNSVISHSKVDEALAIEILKCEKTLLLLKGEVLKEELTIVENWINKNERYIEWVKPDAGALCCVRLKKEMFSDEQVEKFYQSAKNNELQLASGAWFGLDKRCIRLGFGFLPKEKLPVALKIFESSFVCALK